MSGGLNSNAKLSDKLKVLIDAERQNTDSDISIVKMVVEEDGGLDLDSFVKGDVPTSVATFKENLDAKNPAFYILQQGPGRWCFISFIPDGSVKVRQRMLYASSRQIIKEYFGAKYLISDHHFTSLSDLRSSSDSLAKALGASTAPSKGNVSATSNRLNSLKLAGEERRALLSKVELAREDAHDMENIAREEMTKALLNKSSSGSKSSSPMGSLNSGGYHQVALPLMEDAQAAISSFESSKFFAVNPKKDGIELIKTVPVDELPYWNQDSKLPFSTTQEPRFYITLLGDEPEKASSPLWNTTPVQEIKDDEASDERETKSLSGNESQPEYILLYSCPPLSPPRLRMVYSTAIGSLITQIQQSGLSLDFKVELFDDIPSNQRKFQYLYSRIKSSSGGGVQRLGAAPALNKLIQESHERCLQESIEERNLQGIRPKNSLLYPSAPHPVFGLPLPALASQTSDSQN
ncbi:Twinfilin-1 [Entomophthora muscae]|uniref:Twinfilin-1 n=1 Tax=Entomophthora muscae TaxID=34485 RepID=A0ACC2SB71_9FUNG|nr:Twinfilin-1 [Entomophthora muscae]